MRGSPLPGDPPADPPADPIAGPAAGPIQARATGPSTGLPRSRGPLPPPLRRSLRAGLLLAGLGLLSLLGAQLLRPDPRSAWEQAALTRDLPETNAPDQRGLWTDRVQEVLQEAEALGPPPTEPALRRPWLEAQCVLNQRLQSLQRLYGRPVETAAAMGRPPACEQLRPGAPAAR